MEADHLKWWNISMRQPVVYTFEWPPEALIKHTTPYNCLSNTTVTIITTHRHLHLIKYTQPTIGNLLHYDQGTSLQNTANH